MNVVSNECGLKWIWSQMKWSQINVVSNEVVSNDCGLKWMWSQMKWSQMNVVSNDCGLKWMWSQMKWYRMNVVSNDCGLKWLCSQMNVVSNECGLKWTGLKWMWSQMKKSHVNVAANEQVSKERGLKWMSQMNVVLNFVVSNEYVSNERGLKFRGLKWTWSQMNGLKLTADCRPITTPVWKYSKADKTFISHDVERLQSEGLIEPSNSPWRAQPLVVAQENHRKRMVIDYSQMIKNFTQLDAYPLSRMQDLVQNVAQYNVYSTLDLKSAYHQLELPAEDRWYTAFQADGGLWQWKRIPFELTNAVPCFQRVVDDLIMKHGCHGTIAYLDNITVGRKTQEEHDCNLERFLSVAKKSNLTFNETKCVFSSDSVDLRGYRISKGTLQPDPERVKALLELPSWKCKGATKDNLPIRLLLPVDLQALRQNQAPNPECFFSAWGWSPKVIWNFEKRPDQCVFGSNKRRWSICCRNWCVRYSRFCYP